MNRMPALGVNWNRMDPFVRYTPYDSPVIENPYAFPVIQETPPVVAPAPAPASPAVPMWAIVGGSVLAGMGIAALLFKQG